MGTLKHWLSIIRINNLIFTVIIQLFYYFILSRNLLIGDFFPITILLLITFCFGGFTYIVNDLYDIDTDKINKPDKIIVGKNISYKNAKFGGVVFFLIGIIFSILLSFYLKSNFWAIQYLIICAISYLYSYLFKRMFLIGNLVVSIICSFVILLVYLLYNNFSIYNIFTNNILSYLLFFSFIYTLIREIVKDIEDSIGDSTTGAKTLPIILGENFTKIFLYFLIIFSITIIIIYKNNTLIFNCLIGLLVGINLFLIAKIYSAKTQKNYHSISTILKYTMVIGLISTYWV